MGDDAATSDFGTGTGARPFDTSGHKVVASKTCDCERTPTSTSVEMAESADAIDAEALLRTPDPEDLCMDSVPSGRGSSILSEFSNPSAPSRPPSAIGSANPSSSTLPLIRTDIWDMALPPLSEPEYRPCSPQAWTRREVPGSSLPPAQRFFNINTIWLALQGKRNARRDRLTALMARSTSSSHTSQAFNYKSDLPPSGSKNPISSSSQARITYGGAYSRAAYSSSLTRAPPVRVTADKFSSAETSFSGRGHPTRATLPERGRHPRYSQRESKPWYDWRSNLPEVTPAGFRHQLINQHPWAEYVNPRPPRYDNLTDDQITSELPLDRYRPTPSVGYHASRFVRSLFPIYIRDPPSATNKIPVMELQTLKAAIEFRSASLAVIERVEQGRYVEAVYDVPQIETGTYSSTLAPPAYDSAPVLYQIVALGHGSGVILEAKDFFVIGPDRRDLHCIVLDQYAIDLTSGRRGFDRSLVSVKDLVWIYSVGPTRAALRNPISILERSRIPRAVTSDDSSTYFFRAEHFAFITPHVERENGLGIVLNLVERHQRVTKFRAVFEGAPEAVLVCPSLCALDLEPLYEYSIVRARMRQNSSSAIRFSEPPVSVAARDELCRLVSRFLPICPVEGILPLQVLNLRPQDKEWLTDRVNEFRSYVSNTERAKRRMGKVFNVACSALAALSTIGDDYSVHWIRASVPSMKACPLRIDVLLSDMATDGGWTKNRLVNIWLSGADRTHRMRIESSTFDTNNKQLSVRLTAFPWNHLSLIRLVRQQHDDPNPQFADGYVKLEKPAKSASPANEAISRMLHLVDRIPRGTVGYTILDLAYGKPSAPPPPGTTQLDADDAALFRELPRQLHYKDQLLTITDEQLTALKMGLKSHPISVIQAAFGTGKTVVGAIAAGWLALRGKGPVIVATTTNNAAAHFANTLLSCREFSGLALLRYVSDSAFWDDTPSTKVDIHEILKDLKSAHESSLTLSEKSYCDRFREGRALYERYMRDAEKSMDLTEDERDEFLVAEKDVSDCLKKVVNIMFRVRPPAVLLISTASLLNCTAAGGIFKDKLDNSKVIVFDEASQIPEPVAVSLLTLLPRARHLYIGDRYQLQPHAKCPHDANPAVFGGRSIMAVLTRSPLVPKSSLVTTYRCHPALNMLPNILAYGGALVSGAQENARRLLLDRIHFPHPALPFAFIDVEGTSIRAPSRSYLNDEEAVACGSLVANLRQRGVLPHQLCILTFYREQARRVEELAAAHQIEIATVDSIQGREVDVIILLSTRTHLQIDNAAFIDDRLRLNVAVTRCRHGQFILGHAAALRSLPHWGALLRWADAMGAIVPISAIDRIFQ